MLNVVVLMGRLVADPQLRQTPQGTSVASFRIAVDRNFARQGEQRQADFIDIVAWRQQAEFVSKYFQKGSPIVVEGSLQTRQYQDKNGNNRKAVEIVADNVHFVESKRSNEEGDGYGQPYQGNSYGQQGGYNNNASYSKPAAFNEPAAAYSSGSSGDFEEIPGDDDLPF